MGWVIFVVGAILCWGTYLSLMHQGTTQLGDGLKALLCVGAAYVLIAVLVPVVALGSQGELSGFDRTGAINATVAGALGAAGAVCVIFAFRTGGLPLYVAPLIFGFAPIVNVLVSMLIHPPRESLNPMLYVGFALTSIGAAIVLYYRPAS
jgi:branched-subunit amino acid transport protein